jgi:hypothetical protein
MDSAPFVSALAAIDAANAEDPTIVTVRGVTGPKELAHAELVTEWIGRLTPNPSEALLLAARAHHLRRWVSPRSTYPDGRAGYLRWRRDLAVREADDVGRLLAESGYDETTIKRVQAIVRKQNLASDPEVQVLEDAICLTFLETQFDDLAARLTPDRMIEILRKTMGKMSEAGLALVGELSLSATARGLLAQASGTGATA